MHFSPAAPLDRREFLAAASLAAASLGLAGSPATAAPATMEAAALPPLPADNPFATHGPAPKETLPLHTRRLLPVRTVTADNFAPFGRVLTPNGRPRLPINTYEDKLDLFREGFESDQPTEWFIFQGRDRGSEVLFVERHQQLTQTFIPVNGRGFLTVVAAPGCREEDGFPALDELHAFFVPGDTPIQIHRGTWHENPLPLADDTRLLVTSHANLTLAHQQNPDPRLAALPKDLERRWYRSGGYALTLDRASL